MTNVTSVKDAGIFTPEPPVNTFRKNRCWFGEHCWYRHENVWTKSNTANRSNAKQWSMPSRADGSRKEKLKKSKSLPSQAITESVSHAGHKEDTEVKIVYLGENSVIDVIDANVQEIKDSDDEMVKPESVETIKILKSEQANEKSQSTSKKR